MAFDVKCFALWMLVTICIVLVYWQCQYNHSILSSTLTIGVMTFVLFFWKKTYSVVKKLPGYFLYLITDGYRDVYLICATLPRDIRTLRIFSKAFKKKNEITKKCIADIFRSNVERFPEKKAFICADTGKYLTFNEAMNIINNVAKLFSNDGYKKGDQVALFMENDVEYMPIWIGLSKIGVVTALINSKLQGFSLGHSLSVTQFKGIIYGVSLEKSLDTISIFEEKNLDFYVVKPNGSVHNEKAVDLFKMISGGSLSNVMVPSLKISTTDPILYIYTSGSTEKPKAANIRREKFAIFEIYFNTIVGPIKSTDIVYSSLPLYHSSGGLAFASLTISNGCTMIIRTKFSASSYIRDCINHKATICTYIGEMWRYVLAQTPSDSDKMHGIRLTIGNGLRSSLFSKVRRRFGIKHIREFYGATEGNVGFVNLDDTDGAVGHMFKALSFLNTSAIIKCDVETGEIIRSEEGLAIECGPGEPGMVVGLFGDKVKYDGYVNNDKENEKKIGENIFKKGDKVFLSGDLLRRDEYNYLYFVDRIGDTFRWKGENVSTTEIENVISLICPDVGDVVVYPVAIPGNEGNAGMAYILKEDDTGEFNIDQLAENLQKNLPRFAIPTFIRVGKSIDKTGTQKYQKATLKKQSFQLEFFSPEEIIYYFDIKTNAYCLLEKTMLDEINSMKVRF